MLRSRLWHVYVANRVRADDTTRVANFVLRHVDCDSTNAALRELNLLRVAFTLFRNESPCLLHLYASTERNTIWFNAKNVIKFYCNTPLLTLPLYLNMAWHAAHGARPSAITFVWFFFFFFFLTPSRARNRRTFLSSLCIRRCRYRRIVIRSKSFFQT